MITHPCCCGTQMGWLQALLCKPCQQAPRVGCVWPDMATKIFMHLYCDTLGCLMPVPLSA